MVKGKGGIKPQRILLGAVHLLALRNRTLLSVDGRRMLAFSPQPLTQLPLGLPLNAALR